MCQGNTSKEGLEVKKQSRQELVLQMARQKVLNMEGEYVALHKKHDELQRQAQDVTNRMIARKGAIDEFNKFIEETSRESMTNGKKPAKKKKTAKKKRG